MTEKHGLEKIKTIGDAYMVAGGISLPRPDHAEAMAELALDLLDEIEQFNRAYDTSIRIRIGISTGPVVAGVIGAGDSPTTSGAKPSTSPAAWNPRARREKFKSPPPPANG